MNSFTKTGAAVQKMVRLALLTAIIIIMSFTPLGYLKTPGLEITLITIPVAVGAILMGPASGAFLGAIFGLTSFIQCFGLSPFGATLLAINPFSTFAVCFVPRVLMGFLTGVCFKFFSRVFSSNIAACAAASLCGALFNTIFFMSFLIALFGKSDFIMGLQGGANLFAFVIAFVGLNGAVEALVCFIVGAAISRALWQVFKQAKA
ncbi:MAG: ECF transporter S component [Lachnospiraceae bacterium]|nr:ECF transporter S component [Lachnospiraceae bacterium]